MDSVNSKPVRGYFILGRDGTGTWHISRVVHVSARAPFCRFREFLWFMKMFLCKSQHEPIGVSFCIFVFLCFYVFFWDRGPSWENQRGKTHVRCSVFPVMFCYFIFSCACWTRYFPLFSNMFQMYYTHGNAPNIKCYHLPLTNTRPLSRRV